MQHSNTYFRMSRDVKVDDHIHMRYVESSACHVGGHQDGLPLASERVERTQPLCLGKENHCEDDKEYSVGL